MTDDKPQEPMSLREAMKVWARAAEDTVGGWPPTKVQLRAAAVLCAHMERVEAEAAFVEAAKAYMAIHLHPGPDTAERHREHWPKFEAAYRALEGK